MKNISRQYGGFALIYDELMADVPYGQWVSFIEKAFEQSDIEVKLVAELGCGTGNITLPLAADGYEMIGIDLSEDMLMVSREKAEEIGVQPLFLQQDMCQLELYGTVDGILATCDSLNYLESEQQLRQVFRNVSTYLNKGGVFIFDMNTEYRFETIYGNQTLTYRDEEIAYIWENTYHSECRENTYDISFFVYEDEGRYVRFDECHSEYAYSQQCIEDMLKEVGLKLQGVYDDYQWVEPTKTTERLIFVVKK